MRLQDRLGKQNFHWALEKVFQPRTKANEATTKATELKGEKTMKAMFQIEDTTESIEDMMKHASHLDNQIKPALSELFISSKKNQFRLQLKPISPNKVLIENIVPVTVRRIL